jgi:Prophage minor tail protein Z (GPZ)
MSGLDVKVDVRGFNRMAKQFASAGTNIKPALSRAINHTGDKARTQVTRALAKQTGLKYAKVRETLRTIPAAIGRLVYRIVSRGGYTSLKEFGARPTQKGVSAAPWGRRRVFPHTFIVTSLGGHVFERTSSKRFPIRKLWGPAVPAELVKDQTKAAFEGVVAAELPARLDYEIGALLKGRAP